MHMTLTSIDIAHLCTTLVLVIVVDVVIVVVVIVVVDPTNLPLNRVMNS